MVRFDVPDETLGRHSPAGANIGQDEAEVAARSTQNHLELSKSCCTIVSKPEIICEQHGTSPEQGTGRDCDEIIWGIRGVEGDGVQSRVYVSFCASDYSRAYTIESLLPSSMYYATRYPLDNGSWKCIRTTSRVVDLFSSGPALRNYTDHTPL